MENSIIENNIGDTPFTNEELMNADKYDCEIDYRQEAIDRYKNYELENNDGIDDWIEDKDKKALVRYCDSIVKKNYPEYPSPMDELLIKKMYYDTIKQMDKEEYFAEKEAEKKLSVFDRELQNIKEEHNLEYAIKNIKD